MNTPLSTRIRLKIRKIRRDLNPADREFQREWPRIDAIEGWLLPEEGAWLFHAVRSLPRTGNIVEIGSFKGRSTCCLALGCRQTGRRVFAVDTFDGGPDLPKANLLPDFTRNLESMGLSTSVETVVGLSTQVASGWNRPVHLLFIDGSHSYADVLADFHGFFRYVVSGGLVAFHDVTEAWPGVLRAWNEISPGLTKIGYCGGLGYGRKR